MWNKIAAALGAVATVVGLAVAYDRLATDAEVTAGLRSQKRLTDLQFYQQQIEYLELRRDLACDKAPQSQVCSRWQKLLDNAQEEYRRFLRGKSE